MTLDEVIEKLELIKKMNPEYGNKNVVVKTNDWSIGPIASTKVNSISTGIDWNSSKIIIFTNDEIIKK